MYFKLVVSKVYQALIGKHESVSPTKINIKFGKGSVHE
jgi:hypothetical protein